MFVMQSSQDRSENLLPIRNKQLLKEARPIINKHTCLFGFLTLHPACLEACDNNSEKYALRAALWLHSIQLSKSLGVRIISPASSERYIHPWLREQM
jgi:hypothetical protein